MRSDLHYAVQPDLCNLYTCSSNNRSDMDQSALQILAKIYICTKLEFLCFFIRIFGDNFLLLI